ncbi:MAG TPA: hypothetical protein VGL91_19205 [Acidobacteriota bacterium]
MRISRILPFSYLESIVSFDCIIDKVYWLRVIDSFLIPQLQSANSQSMKSKVRNPKSAIDEIRNPKSAIG